MSLFGLFGPDLSVPDIGGWRTSVAPGSGDSGTLGGMFRLGLFGSTDPQPGLAKTMGAGFDAFSKMGEAGKGGGAAPAMHKPQMNTDAAMAALLRLPTQAQSPFATPGQGPGPKKTGSIYGAPFAPA